MAIANIVIWLFMYFACLKFENAASNTSLEAQGHETRGSDEPMCEIPAGKNKIFKWWPFSLLQNVLMRLPFINACPFYICCVILYNTHFC